DGRGWAAIGAAGEGEVVMVQVERDGADGGEDETAEPLMVQAENVAKAYVSGAVSTPALRGVSLAVPKGEMVAIMGPSGCGKTTLLNCLSGLDTYDNGRILIEGTDLAALDDDARTTYRARRMGFIFQFYNLLPVLSALENVELPLVVYGVNARLAPG